MDCNRSEQIPSFKCLEIVPFDTYDFTPAAKIVRKEPNDERIHDDRTDLTDSESQIGIQDEEVFANRSSETT